MDKDAAKQLEIYLAEIKRRFSCVLKMVESLNAEYYQRLRFSDMASFDSHVEELSTVAYFV
ncbi:MAG: hypothetical protein LBK41_09615 [Clostridiales bacterium]|jgi:hypothetical protein|nr:hypothetical protein [Clostridiales bacterium]